MQEPDEDRRLVLKAISQKDLIGFACVLLDGEPAWGALLDNLHVKPSRKRQGIGRRLFDASRRWVGATAPGTPIHLTVIEANQDACRFYQRLGGRLVERVVKEVIPGTELVVLRYQWDTGTANFQILSSV